MRRARSAGVTRVAMGRTVMARGLVTIVLWVSWLVIFPAASRADSIAGSPTPASAPTLEATPTPSPTPTLAPAYTPTARPTATPLPHPVADKKVRKHHRAPHRLARPGATETATPTPNPTVEVKRPTKKHHRRHKKHRKSATVTAVATATETVTPTPSPTPTATPPVSLQTEDSIKPVICNGPSRPVAKAPFLTPPFAGWTSLVSYFDHDQPNFAHDGLIITATGATASPDAAHRAADFPAYWSSRLRQYLYYDGHNGYDYNISYQPVYAAASGKVIFSAYEYSFAHHLGYGKMVMINHGHGYVSLYGHFSTLLVRSGQRVRRGQKIGISGNTGHSTGPHLHFTVFHNCTPTDPYGWFGQGQDPLYSYMGDESMYLWKTAPLITNPPPQWPGLAAIPSFAASRVVLFHLPSTRQGTNSFTQALTRELRKARSELASRGVSSRIDAFVGALRIDVPVAPAMLYRLSGVASIGAPDVADDARVDTLRAIGRAALVTPHRRLPIDRSHAWSGYLIQWHGRTFLVGKGQKGKAVSLHFNHVGVKTSTRVAEADSTTGSYALDLGALTGPQIQAVANQLSGASKRRVAVPVRSRGAVSHPAESQRPTSHRDAGGRMMAAAVAGLVVVLILSLLASPARRSLFRSRHTSSGPADDTQG